MKRPPDDDKFAPLGEDEAAQKPPPGEEWTPIVPVPASAPDLPSQLVDFITRTMAPGFKAGARWRYLDAGKRLTAIVVRYNKAGINGGEPDKQFRQFTWCRSTDGRERWRCKALPQPRQLYNLDKLAGRPEAPVLVVEGEKTAGAAAIIPPDHVVVTSSHGAENAKTADWSPLAGREVIIWPDHDESGAKYAADAAQLVRKAGALSVRIVRVPARFPVKWDLADNVPDGVDLRAMLDAAVEWDPPGEAPATSEPSDGGATCDNIVWLTRENPGAPFRQEALEYLARLRKENRSQYESTRSQLKGAGCRVGELDKAIAKALGGGNRRETQPDVLIELAQAAMLFHNAGDGYADVEVNGHRETWKLRSRGFKRWLTHRYFEKTKGAPNSEAIQGALGVLEARAFHDSPERQVHVRVGEQDGRVYIDLCDEAWQAIEIDAGGWRVIVSPPVRFCRSKGMRPLPIPVSGGSIDALRPFLNLRPDADDDFVLALSWLLAALRDRGPFPVLALAGESGTAKSTFLSILRSLVDPSKPLSRSLPREDRDLFIAATSSHVLAFDNISGISPWLSDALCRLSTGGGFATRALYTDDEEKIFDAMRPTILNGIKDFVGRPDLASRTIFLTLQFIPEISRRAEREFWEAFEIERPRILGALLDAVSHGLKRLPGIHLKRLPRMADFAVWATACETAFYPSGTFERAYDVNRADAGETIVEGDHVATALRKFMVETQRQLDGTAKWEGTAGKLLPVLTKVAGDCAANAKDWPQSPRALSGCLREAAPNLRELGVDVRFAREGNKRTRIITVIASANREGSEPSTSSAPSANTTNDSDINDMDMRTIWGRKMPVTQGPSAGRPHPNPLKNNKEDDADEADANFPTQSAPEKKGEDDWECGL